MKVVLLVLIGILFLLGVVFILDKTQKRDVIRRNFPVVGHLRKLFIAMGPPIRQYFIASNREELPFNRSKRNWIYHSADKENNYEGFGTDKDIYAPGHIFINPTMFPFKINDEHVNSNDPSFIPCSKVIGLKHNRKQPFRPYSIVNISAMSYGSLSKQAQSALNIGASKVGCYHNTGEGGLSPYHQKGGDVIFQIGTGYFGCGRTNEKNERVFDFSIFKEKVLDAYPGKVKAIEVKLSQGAKPGKGGVLPAKKNSIEIAKIRGVEPNTDVLSPANHSAFDSVKELVDFIEELAEFSGLPVGIKSAVGDLDHWYELAEIMSREKRGPDFITIDGGEGGTGAAPPSFADHVSLPWVFGFKEVYKIFQKYNLTNDVVFIGSGKLGFPQELLKAFAMGVDIVNVAREAMLSIGCIQAQDCHTGNCPTGIATQNKRLSAGIVPEIQAIKFGNYINTLRKETLAMVHACGYEHPCQMKMKDVEISGGDNNKIADMETNYGYVKSEVPFTSMQSLFDCQYLGGLGKQANVLLKH